MGLEEGGLSYQAERTGLRELSRKWNDGIYTIYWGIFLNCFQFRSYKKSFTYQ